MNWLVGLALMTTASGPPSAEVLKRIEAVPILEYGLVAQGYVAGLASTRFGLEPFIR